MTIQHLLKNFIIIKNSLGNHMSAKIMYQYLIYWLNIKIKEGIFEFFFMQKMNIIYLNESINPKLR